MILWGGYNGSVLDTGGRYNPAADTWIAINSGTAPIARDDHTALWIGSEMIVWGSRPQWVFFRWRKVQPGDEQLDIDEPG